MLNQKDMLTYAHRLVRDSAVMSAEETVGIRLMTLCERSYSVESVLNLFKRDIKHDVLDDADTAALEAAVKRIEEGK